MAEEKTVLCVFQGRSRPITFKSGGNPKEEYENLLEAVLAGFHDSISKTNQATSSASSYHLERERVPNGIGLLTCLVTCRKRI